MTNVDFLDLGTGYQLASFADFETAFLATDTICRAGLKVAYLNEANHISETEIRAYVRQVDKSDTVMYQNYHASGNQSFTASATESFRTALEVLETRNSLKARYVAVLYPRYIKEPQLQDK